MQASIGEKMERQAERITKAQHQINSSDSDPPPPSPTTPANQLYDRKGREKSDVVSHSCYHWLGLNNIFKSRKAKKYTVIQFNV